MKPRSLVATPDRHEHLGELHNAQVLRVTVVQPDIVPVVYLAKAVLFGKMLTAVPPAFTRQSLCPAGQQV